MLAAVDATERAGVWTFTFADDGKVPAARFLLIDQSSKFHLQANESGHGFFFSSIWRQRMPYRRSKSFNA